MRRSAEENSSVFLRPELRFLVVSSFLYSVFLIYGLQNITTENHPLVKPAKEAGRGFRQSNVAQATIHMQGIQVVLKSWAHQILNVEQSIE